MLVVQATSRVNRRRILFTNFLPPRLVPRPSPLRCLMPSAATIMSSANISDEEMVDAPNPVANGTAKKNASSLYQKLTQLEHVLKRPDTYIGSVEFSESTMWICDAEGKMEYKTVSIVPGIYKIFDEILVNAADNKVRDPSMKSIKVDIDAANNKITVRNDGKGIPIEMHDKEKMYIPELIFGNLLTSSNYNDEEQKVTGGRNGFGAKLCNIFSTKFVVETADNTSAYRQTWTNNMTKVEPPKITKNSSGKSFTSITFYPDLQKFGMTKLDDDLLGVLRRRVYDIAGTTQGVSVSLNGKVIPLHSFKAYVDMFVKALESQSGESEKLPVVYCKPNDRWEIAFSLSDGQFNQMSFVNSIATTSGGTHVNYITDQLVNYTMDFMAKRNNKSGARGGKLQKVQVKGYMFVFINCKINNPSFTSQTKEQLTSKVSSFGSKCELPDKFLKDALNKTGLLDRIVELSERNADKELKKQDGGKKKRLTGFVKLEDANKAGTRESSKCTLILTEGDSAHALAVSGLAVVGRDYYGCYPLRGKMLNVRDASQDQILKNQEIQALKQIMGLQHKKSYTSTDGLRYGHIMIMTDQDYDGSHIKGLIINFLESSFPGLLDIPGFLVEFITPIVKVTVSPGTKSQTVIPFFTMPEYEEWRDTIGRTCKWTQKYYKGLGSSTPTDFREYFSRLTTHEKGFLNLQDGDKDRIELAFSKSRSDDRKQWLQDFKPGTFLDPELQVIPISEFIDKELILFSMADNVRSIPSVVDGLKPGQRKVLFGAFERKLTKEIKVGQFMGWVSERAAYHHGDQALVQTIVAMAQDFVGTNNFYYLLPNGGFGSRATGGKDAAAARYIFTVLNPLTRVLMNSKDFPLLNYLKDDESTVEPEYYVPIIPTLLVNGSEGIGTGWSSNIPSFNPVDIIANIRRMMDGEALKPMVPWYRGWTGTIEKIPGSEQQYRVCGRIEEIDENTLAITELPVRMWTQTMKEFLLKSIIGSSKEKDKKTNEFIEDMLEEHGTGIRFIIKLSNAEMAKAREVGLYNKFKLIATLNTSNMVAFDPQGRLRRYATAEDMLKEFYYVRLEYYQKRKEHLAQEMKHTLEKLSSQARFVKMIIEKQLSVSNRPKKSIVEDLKKHRFPKFGPEGKPVWADADESIPVDEEDQFETESETEGPEPLTAASDAPKPSSASYDYLLTMSILSLSRERYEKLLKQRDGVEEDLNALLAKTVFDLWNADLDAFLEGWHAFLQKDEEKREALVPSKTPKSGAKKRKSADDDDDDDFTIGQKKRKIKPKVAAAVVKVSVPIPVPPIEAAPIKKARVKKEPAASRSSTPVNKDAIPAAQPSPSVAAIKEETPEDAAPPPTDTQKAPINQPKKAAPERATKTKKTKDVSDDDDDIMDFVDEPIMPRPSRPRRAAAAAPKVISESEVSEEENAADNSLFQISDDEFVSD